MDEAILRFSSNHNWFDESRSDGRVNTPLERVVTAKSRHFDLLLILDAGHSSPLSTAARDAAISDGNDDIMGVTDVAGQLLDGLEHNVI
jgi:hypothetical protein